MPRKSFFRPPGGRAFLILRRPWLWLLAGALAWLAWAAAPVGAQPPPAPPPGGRPVVGLFDFQSRTLNQDRIEALSQALWARLLAAGDLGLLPREPMRNYLIASDQFPFAPYGPAVPLGIVSRALGADYLVMGHIETAAGLVTVDLSIWSAREGRLILKNAQLRPLTLEALMAAMDDLAGRIRGKLLFPDAAAGLETKNHLVKPLPCPPPRERPEAEKPKWTPPVKPHPPARPRDAGPRAERPPEATPVPTPRATPTPAPPPQTDAAADPNAITFANAIANGDPDADVFAFADSFADADPRRRRASSGVLRRRHRPAPRLGPAVGQTGTGRGVGACQRNLSAAVGQ